MIADGATDGATVSSLRAIQAKLASGDPAALVAVDVPRLAGVIASGPPPGRLDVSMQLDGDPLLHAVGSPPPDLGHGRLHGP